MLVHIVNFYLEERNQSHCRRLAEVARGNSSTTLEILALYAREALRLDPVTVGVTREVGSSMFVPGVSQRVDLHAGDKVFLSLKKANLDEVCTCISILESLDLNKRFIQPESHAPRNYPAVDNPHNYDVFLGDGVIRLLGENFVFMVGILILHRNALHLTSNQTAAHILKIIFSLKNIRRAPGPSGQLRRYTQSLHGTPQYFYLDTKQRPTVWPTSMLLQVSVNPKVSLLGSLTFTASMRSIKEIDSGVFQRSLRFEYRCLCISSKLFETKRSSDY